MTQLTLSEMEKPVWDGTGMPDDFWPSPTPPPVLELTLTVTPESPVTVGTPVTISVTANFEPTDPVLLTGTLDGAPGGSIPLTQTSPTTWEDEVDTILVIPGSVYELWVTSGATESNHVTVTFASTMADLRAFADANGVTYPTNVKKAELLALIGDVPRPELRLMNSEEN